MPTIIKTSYQDGSAADLMAYISRDGHAVKDRTGRELSLGEQAQFVDQSEDYEFEREMIVSPERGEELSQRELELRTRQTMREFTEDRPSARYVYAVHDDSDHVHSHVVLTGERDDLYMDRDTIRRVRERSNELFRNAERANHRTPEQEQTQAQTQTRALADRAVDRDRAVDDLTLASETEQHQGPTHNRDWGPER